MNTPSHRRNGEVETQQKLGNYRENEGIDRRAFLVAL